MSWAGAVSLSVSHQNRHFTFPDTGIDLKAFYFHGNPLPFDFSDQLQPYTARLEYFSETLEQIGDWGWYRSDHSPES